MSEQYFYHELRQANAQPGNRFWWSPCWAYAMPTTTQIPPTRAVVVTASLCIIPLLNTIFLRQLLRWEFRSGKIVCAA